MKRFLALILALTVICSCAMSNVLTLSAASDTGVSGFTATSGDKKVTLSWKAVSGVTSYDVFWKRSTATEWQKAGSTKKKSANITGLNNDVSYDFKISANGVESASLTLSPSATKKTTVSAPDAKPSSDTNKASMESAEEAVKNFGAGYNIGNTFDSCGTWLSSNASVKSFETAWGNPQVTEEYIKTLKKQGIGAIRLPVTWYLNMDKNNTIRKAWLDRVQEVVDWILDNDMYCIINVHHDTGTEGWIIASDSGYKNAKDKFGKIWEQVAERFKDYGDHLIFECMNETLNDADDWNATDAASRKAITKYQQLFIDKVRASGGNNATRNLVVSTYAASSNTTIINDFVLPKDTVEGHLIMEVHNYDPQGFTWKNATWTKMRDTWGTDQDKRDIDNFMKTLSAKAKKLGVPVIIGEFGSQDKKNDKDRAAHAGYFVKSATDRGIRCFYWDDGGEYILINRSTNAILHSTILKALVDNAK